MPPKKTAEEPTAKRQRLERELDKLKREQQKLPIEINKLRMEINLIKDNTNLPLTIEIVEGELEGLLDQQVEIADQIEDTQNKLKATGLIVV